MFSLKKIYKYLIAVSLFVLFILLSAFILNLKVSYYQGIDYRVKQVKIPLYLKIIDLFSRHYHYRGLAKEITSDYKSEEEKVLRIFDWTHSNIRNVSEDLPVIDDHVWNIIIRGYGTSDQYSDVFTTLCNYVGVDAFFTFVKSKEGNKIIALSFVKIKEKWHVFDPFSGVYFIDNKGNLADVETIKSGLYLVEGHKGTAKPDYSSYICNLPSIKNIGLRRANIQSPIKRLIYEIKKMIRIL